MPPPAPGRGGSGRVPPPSYICYRCRQPGHFIQDCPNNSIADGGDENTATHARRAPVGIPQVMLRRVAATTEGGDAAGGFQAADGSLVRMVADEKKFSRVTAKSLEKVDAEHVPEELKCPITKRLFEDPVHAPPHTCATTHHHTQPPPAPPHITPPTSWTRPRRPTGRAALLRHLRLPFLDLS